MKMKDILLCIAFAAIAFAIFVCNTPKTTKDIEPIYDIKDVQQVDSVKPFGGDYVVLYVETNYYLDVISELPNAEEHIAIANDYEQIVSD